MLTPMEAALAARTVKANPKKRAACSRGGHGQKEYGTIFNTIGAQNAAVIRRIRISLMKHDSKGA